MHQLVFGLMLSLTLTQTPASPAGAGGLDRALALYDAAAYEEALSLLISIEDERNIVEVEQYRALCLLALNRPAEAERALEQIVVRRPFFRMDVGDVSPRLVLLYRDVRQRMIPLVARSLYAQGKANFDARRYAQATTQLQDVITLLSSEEPATVGDGLPELRQLAEGFLALSASGAEVKAPPPTPAVPASVSDPVLDMVARPPAEPQPNRIYSMNDRGVVAPVEIVRRVPTSVEVGPQERQRLYQGLIEVVIDESGRVQSSDIRRSISATFDAALVEAARDWRFQPATLGGKPVAFRKSFEVIVWGMSSRQAFGDR